MNIVFLDIDGVLTKNIASVDSISEMFEPEALKQLERIVEETKAILVLNSGLKAFLSPDELALEICKAGGKNIKFHSATPTVYLRKGKEIQLWLSRLSEAELAQAKFVILDDDPEGLGSFISCLVLAKNGLTQEVADQVINKFKVLQ